MPQNPDLKTRNQILNTLSYHLYFGLGLRRLKTAILNNGEAMDAAQRLCDLLEKIITESDKQEGYPIK